MCLAKVPSSLTGKEYSLQQVLVGKLNIQVTLGPSVCNVTMVHSQWAYNVRWESLKFLEENSLSLLLAMMSQLKHSRKKWNQEWLRLHLTERWPAEEETNQMKLTRWSGRKYLRTAYLIKGQYPEIIKPPTIQQEQSPEQTNLQVSKCAFFFFKEGTDCQQANGTTVNITNH